jgi:TonB family protein
MSQFPKLLHSQLVLFASAAPRALFTRWLSLFSSDAIACMKILFLVTAMCVLLQACAPIPTRVVESAEADFYYKDWRRQPPQKAFDVAPAPKDGMIAFIERLSYPATLRQQAVGGVVRVLVSLDTDGRVLDAQVIRSVHPILDQIVVEAIFHSRWTPARKNGAPIALKFFVPVAFTP